MTSYNVCISAIIISLNVEPTIAECIQALQRVCDEVILLDSGSTDGTIQIAKELNAKVVQVEWQGYAKTKNLGHEIAAYDWILSIDADEILSSELQENIKMLNPTDNTVYYLDRITAIGQKWIKHSGWYPDWKPRLFHKEIALWKGNHVHEYLDFESNVAKQKLSGKLYHYSYKDFDALVDRSDKYAKLSAQALLDKGKKPSAFKRYLAPAFRFFKVLIIQKGFLDGKAGLKIASRDCSMVKKKYQWFLKLYLEKTMTDK